MEILFYFITLFSLILVYILFYINELKPPPFPFDSTESPPFLLLKRNDERLRLSVN